MKWINTLSGVIATVTMLSAGVVGMGVNEYGGNTLNSSTSQTNLNSSSAEVSALSYSFYGQSITHVDHGAQVKINGHEFTQTWSVFSLQNNTPIKQHFSGLQEKLYKSGSSVSQLFISNNSNYKSLMIYTESANTNEQTLVLQNLNSINSTFIAEYTIKLPGPLHNYHERTSYGSSLPINWQSNSGEIFSIIPSSVSGLSLGKEGVSWAAAMSDFSAGFISLNSHTLTLVFGPVTLVHNESYTIDPSYTTWPVTVRGDEIWNAVSESPAGAIGLMLAGPGSAENTNNPFDLQLAVQFQPEPGYYVNYMTQTAKWTGSSTGQTSSVNMELEYTYYQNWGSTNNANMNSLGNALTTIGIMILNAYGIPVINPEAFVQHGNPNQGHNDAYTWTEDAGHYFAAQLEHYPALGSSYDLFWFKDSMLFGTYMRWTFNNPYYYGYTASNPVLEYFSYSSSIEVSNGGPNILLGGAISTSFSIGHYDG